jgi:hypothetical protein
MNQNLNLCLFVCFVFVAGDCFLLAERLPSFPSPTEEEKEQHAKGHLE